MEFMISKITSVDFLDQQKRLKSKFSFCFNYLLNNLISNILILNLCIYLGFDRRFQSIVKMSDENFFNKGSNKIKFMKNQQ